MPDFIFRGKQSKGNLNLISVNRQDSYAVVRWLIPYPQNIGINPLAIPFLPPPQNVQGRLSIISRTRLEGLPPTTRTLLFVGSKSNLSLKLIYQKLIH